METKHTPGPWTFDHDGEAMFVYRDAVSDDDCESICDLCKHQPDDLQLANARLIAAAPDLLEALAQLRLKLRLSRIKMDVREDFSLMVADAAAGTAIFKAIGKPTHI